MGNIGRVKMKKLLLILGILMLISSVQAWTIVDEKYSGTIEFHENGVGVAHINGFLPTMFSWKWNEGNKYTAMYLWYSVNFTHDPINNVITSDRFPGAKLV